MVNGHIILYYVLSSPNHTHKWQNRYLATTAAVEADFIRSGSTGRPCVVHRRNNDEPIPRTISLPDI